MAHSPVTVSRLSRALQLSEAGVWILVGVAAVLTGAALLRWTVARLRPGEEADRAWGSIVTWWALFLVLVLVLASGRIGVFLATLVVSLLLVAEALRLMDRSRLLPGAAAAALLLYAWAWLDWVTVYLVALPVAALVVAALGVVRRARLPSTASEGRPALHYPLLLTLIGPAYAFAAASLPAPREMPEAAMGWFLLLILLTELNDMAQAWWGRALGSRPLAPEISPGKTWEGLLGGVATTAVVALAVSPALTSWGRTEPSGVELGLPPWAWSVGLGVAVGFSGIAGDLAASALKRRAGVKDAGTLLPGQGGLLDRFDSLAVTAPVFFLLTWTLWSPAP